MFSRSLVSQFQFQCPETGTVEFGLVLYLRVSVPFAGYLCANIVPGQLHLSRPKTKTLPPLESEQCRGVFVSSWVTRYAGTTEITQRIHCYSTGLLLW